MAIVRLTGTKWAESEVCTGELVYILTAFAPEHGCAKRGPGPLDASLREPHLGIVGSALDHVEVRIEGQDRSAVVVLPLTHTVSPQAGGNVHDRSADLVGLDVLAEA